MAYSYTFDIQKVILRGVSQKLFRVTISETDVQTNSEAVVTGLPIYGTIIRYQATLTPAAATTIDTGIGTVAAWAALSQDEVSQNQIAAAHIDNQEHIRYHSSAGRLVVRNTPDVNGDSIESEMLICQGWDL